MSEYVMQDEHEKHLRRIKNKFLEKVDSKYRAGQEEHGGKLWKMKPSRLAREVRNEAIDQFVYIYTLIELVDYLERRIAELEAENASLRD